MVDANIHLLPENQPTYQAIDENGKHLELAAHGPDNEVYGYSLMLASSFFLKLMALTSRTVTVYYGLSVQNMIFLRGSTLFTFTLISVFLFSNAGQVFDVPRPLLPLLLARGVFGATSLAILYKVYSLIPLYLATTIFFLNPFFTTLISGIILGERIAVPEVLAACVSLVGVGLVGKPSFDTAGIMHATSLLGMGLAVLAAVIVAIAYVSIRALGTRVHFLASLLSFSLMVTIIGVALGGATLPGLTTGVTIALGGCVFGFIGQCCVNLGFQNCRANTGTFLRTADVPFAYFLGMVFLDEVPRVISLIGSAFVMFGTITVGIVAIQKKRMSGMNESENNKSVVDRI